MENYKMLRYCISNQIATIEFNRPNQFNAMSRQLALELHQALKAAELDDEVRVIIVTGTGKAFCSGADLAELADAHSAAPGTIEEQINSEFGPVVSIIYEMSKTVICAVNGPVAGGGCAFPLVCDLTVMADEAYFYPAFGAIGLVPDCGISWLLQRQLGSKVAYQLCVENEKLSALRCRELGLVNKVVPVNILMEQARRCAEQIVAGVPHVPVELKKLFKDVSQMGFVETIAYEAKIQDRLLRTPDSRKRVSAILQ